MAKQIVYSQIIFDVLLRRFGDAARVSQEHSLMQRFRVRGKRASRQDADNALRAAAGIELLQPYPIKIEHGSHVKLPNNWLITNLFAARHSEDPKNVLRAGYSLSKGDHELDTPYLELYEQGNGVWTQSSPLRIVSQDFPHAFGPDTLEYQAFEALQDAVNDDARCAAAVPRG